MIQIKRISPHSLILVDTASFCSTSIFDLSKHPEIDMIVLSFYKLFGFPTGVGCLIVKTSVLLSHFTSVSSYFGGGSILGLHHGSTGFVKRKGDNLIQRGFSSSNIVSDGEDASPSGLDNQLLYERFEHGTLPFLEILSIDHGFDYIESLHNMNTSYSISSSSPHLTGWVWLEFHVNYLANLCRSKMRSLVHCNGQPVCVLYPDEQSAGTIVATSMGPIINFNLKR